LLSNPTESTRAATEIPVLLVVDDAVAAVVEAATVTSASQRNP
jgi:hypothetical protein